MLELRSCEKCLVTGLPRWGVIVSQWWLSQRAVIPVRRHLQRGAVRGGLAEGSLQRGASQPSEEGFQRGVFSGGPHSLQRRAFRGESSEGGLTAFRGGLSEGGLQREASQPSEKGFQRGVFRGGPHSL